MFLRIVHRKEKYDFDRLLYVVDSGQRHHFQQLIMTCRKLGILSASDELSVKDYHIDFGRISGMSTRRGEVGQQHVAKCLHISSSQLVADHFEDKIFGCNHCRVVTIDTFTRFSLFECFDVF